MRHFDERYRVWDVFLKCPKYEIPVPLEFAYAFSKIKTKVTMKTWDTIIFIFLRIGLIDWLFYYSLLIVKFEIVPIDLSLSLCILHFSKNKTVVLFEEPRSTTEETEKRYIGKCVSWCGGVPWWLMFSLSRAADKWMCRVMCLCKWWWYLLIKIFSGITRYTRKKRSQERKSLKKKEKSSCGFISNYYYS